MAFAVTLARKDRFSITSGATPPTVCNFGDVKVGSTNMLVVNLHNHSPIVAYYHFQVRVARVEAAARGWPCVRPGVGWML